MKTIFEFKTIIIVAIIIAATAFTSCRQGTKSTANGNTPPAAELDKARVEKEVREFVYPLPTTFEVTEMLNRIGAAYILTLSNPVEKANSYLTEKSRAINLGIYGTDMSYATTYNQKQQIVDCMNVSKKLIDELNITGVIAPDIVERIEQHANDKDYLVNLITNTFYDTYEQLNKSSRGATSMLVLAGSWVEALYISTHISSNTYENKEMVQIIMNQKSSLSTLIELMELMPDSKPVLEVLEQLKPIHTIYSSIDEGAISEAQLNSISQTVAELRAQMIR